MGCSSSTEGQRRQFNNYGRKGPAVSRIAAAVKKVRREEVQGGPKRPKSRIPEPQVLRIMERHVSGESNREIARTEAVDRKTVARVVGSAEFQDHIRLQRERFYGMIPAALDTLQHALEQKNDARIAYQVLADTGVIPSAEERASALTQPPRSISDEAREALVSSLSEQDRIVWRVLKMFQQKAAAFGMPEDSIIPPAQPQVGAAGASNSNPE
jgi:hypothetical protein